MVFKAKRNKKLLLITPFFHPNVGGVETRLLDLVNTLVNDRYRVVVITYQPLTTMVKGPIYEKKENIAIFRIPWWGNDLFHRLLLHPFFEIIYIVPGLLLASILYLFFKHRSIDTVHTPGLNAAIVGRVISFIFRKRWVVSTHTIYEMDVRSVFARACRFLLSASHSIVALSDPSKDELIKIGLEKEKIHVELTWIDHERFIPLDKENCRKKLSLGKGFCLLFVGRLLPEKGVDILLELAEMLPQMTFLIIGVGPEETKVRKAESKLTNIRFFGFIEQNLLPLYYSASDLLLLPSRYREGLGRVVIEGLSCGLPAVINETAAIAPLVEEAVYRVQATPDAMAKLILKVATSNEELNEKHAVAPKLARKLFGPNNVHGLYKAYGWVN